MGSPRLNKKIELHYRRGYTHSHCGCCDHFVRNHEVRKCTGEPMGVEPRCRIIGLENGRGYRINPNSVCDAYNNTETIKRLRGY